MTRQELNREILRLSIPSILANITVPVVGMVDTAVAGHLPGIAAVSIGAISLGSTLFTLLYWLVGFLRTGTGGLTAQAFGRDDMNASAGIMIRGLGIAGIVSALILALQLPFIHLATLFTDGTAEVEKLATRYFLIRVWAAPATISLMVFRGWFAGMQDSMSSMWTDLIVNVVNMAASIILALGIGGWEGLGFDGVPLGTVVAQYSGMLWCIGVVYFKYRNKVFSRFERSSLGDIFSRKSMGGFMAMNMDLLGRGIFFISIYVGFTALSTGLGDMMLACGAVLMQLLMFFSFFTDGFAYAGEALAGRFIGARDNAMLRMSTKYVFFWAMGVAVLFMGIYAICGVPALRILTDDPAVIEACRAYLPWLMLMPPLGCAAFTWDGIYMGATASKGIFHGMLLAAVGFYAVWYMGNAALNPGPELALHILMAAYFMHLLMRTLWLSVRAEKEVLSR